MKIAFRHIHNNCVLCHANKLKDVDPMAECMPIMLKFVISLPVAFGLGRSLCEERHMFRVAMCVYVKKQLHCYVQMLHNQPLVRFASCKGRRGETRLSRRKDQSIIDRD